MLNFEPAKAGDKIAVIKTNMGDITVKMLPEAAPKAVENFLTHAENGYYDGIKFHRVIDGFMIQGGDPTATGMGGESIWGKPFEDEFSKEAFNFKGALSMANSGPSTNGSQFFIVQASSVPEGMLGQMEQAGFPKEAISKYEQVGGTPWLDFRHTVFGQVTEGMDVVDAIAKTETDGSDRPVNDVIINTVEVKTL